MRHASLCPNCRHKHAWRVTTPPLHRTTPKTSLIIQLSTYPSTPHVHQACYPSFSRSIPDTQRIYRLASPAWWCGMCDDDAPFCQNHERGSFGPASLRRARTRFVTTWSRSINAFLTFSRFSKPLLEFWLVGILCVVIIGSGIQPRYQANALW